MINQFYVRIKWNIDSFEVGYWYNTDLRYIKTYPEIPVIEIYNWIRAAYND